MMNFEQEKFVITSPAVADWAVEKVKEERSRRDIFVSVAESKIIDLQLQIGRAFEDCDQKTSNLLCALDDFLDTVPAKKTKTQCSLTLPGGKITRTFGKKDYAYEEKTLLDYPHINGKEYIKSVEKPLWGELKKGLEIRGDIVVRTDTGEVVDCIKVIVKPPVCEVK